MSSLEYSWPLSRSLLLELLEDRITDCFVVKLVWERLGYQPEESPDDVWLAGKNTPNEWIQAFPKAPEVISTRYASVHLTRSIPKEYKQSLKSCLNFEGYKVDELFPRRTRRATAVNWLLAWMLSRDDNLPQDGPLPRLSEAPVNPLRGHPGDREIE